MSKIKRYEANENLIDQFYESFSKEDILKTKLTNRAQKSESDIQAGKVFSKEEIEQKTNDMLR